MKNDCVNLHVEMLKTNSQLSQSGSRIKKCNIIFIKYLKDDLASMRNFNDHICRLIDFYTIYGVSCGNTNENHPFNCILIIECLF